MSWRPDDWVSKYTDIFLNYAFEEGAEAMLEALKAKGYHYSKKNTLMALEGIECDSSCWVVIIPEDI